MIDGQVGTEVQPGQVLSPRRRGSFMQLIQRPQGLSWGSGTPCPCSVHPVERIKHEEDRESHLKRTQCHIKKRQETQGMTQWAKYSSQGHEGLSSFCSTCINRCDSMCLYSNSGEVDTGGSPGVAGQAA